MIPQGADANGTRLPAPCSGFFLDRPHNLRRSPPAVKDSGLRRHRFAVCGASVHFSGTERHVVFDGLQGERLREDNVTLLIGVDGNETDRLVQIISDSCKTREQFLNVLPPDAAPVGTFMPSPVKVQMGGAVCFVLDVERFERF